MNRRPRKVIAGALLALAGTACAGLLGIEELDPGLGADAGNGGNGGEDGGDGGSTGSGGGQSSGGAGGGTGGSGDGGASVDAGGDSSSIPDGAPSPTVEGRVVDFFLQPVVGALVTIGGETVQTGDDGAFTVEDVAPTYNATIDLTALRDVGAIQYGWRFEGLTRRDPTLQVYRAGTERTGTLNVHVNSVTFPLAADQSIVVALGTETSAYSTTLDGENELLYPIWRGGETTQGTAHALFWEFAGTQDLPTAYLAADTRSVGLDVTAPADVTFDLTVDMNMPVGTISGNVTNGGPPERQNHVFVHYSDGSATELVNDWEATNGFSYIVPTLPDSGITVAAQAGYYNGNYAVAYTDDRVAGESGLALNIPAPATLSTPAQAAMGVTPDTTFRWSGGNQVFVLWVEHTDWYEANFVVTTSKETTLGDLPALRAGAPCFWYIETHGSFATVDEAAGPDGFLSSYVTGFPRGPRRESGTYTLSAGRDFTTAP